MKTNESMIEAAIAILTDNGEPMKFSDLWEKVTARLEIDEESANAKIGRFYTDLSFCGTVVVLSNNTWDLRARHTYDAVHIDVAEVYNEVEDTTDQDQVDAQENKEYDQSVQGSVASIYEDDIDNEDEETNDTTSQRERDAATEALGVSNDL